ncbi:MAG: aminotransferase class I/II-fold pyridoxal phosphate-dependent enzyme [Roseburia sp.]|nr:aminotransferase class I/II-fold pyridoxal phosphate-dependent enzyme [Roseburia sp.]
MIFIDRRGGAASALCDSLSGTDYVARLENIIEDATERNCVAMCSSDAALHTALYLCGATRGDYVFVPSFTFYSYISTVVGCGCVPVFLDCDPVTRCVSPSALETAFVWAQLQNKPPKAVIVDDAFGSVADYDVLLPLCKAWDVPLIELACDAFGGEYKGVPCGANGDLGVLSFSKRISGAGGALLCGDECGAARGFARLEYSEGENHDYRLHNALAALDCALLESADKISARARANLAALVAAADGIAAPVDGDAAAYALCKADGVAAELAYSGFDVKTPPPVHAMPQYRDCAFFEHERGFDMSSALGGYCLINMDISAPKRMRLVRMLKRMPSRR